jgi:hypothetical protein
MENILIPPLFVFDFGSKRNKGPVKSGIPLHTKGTPLFERMRGHNKTSIAFLMLVSFACAFFLFQKVQRAAPSGRYPSNNDISFAVPCILSKRPDYVNKKMQRFTLMGIFTCRLPHTAQCRRQRA